MVRPITQGDHKEETTGQKYNGSPITQGGHNQNVGQCPK